MGWWLALAGGAFFGSMMPFVVMQYRTEHGKQ